MLFNSIEFLFFAPSVLILYFLLPSKWRWLLLLVASYYFYAVWNIKYLSLLLISTAVDYGCGLAMGKKKHKQAKKPYLAISLITNLGILLTFKYYNFFIQASNDIASLFGWEHSLNTLSVLLPMGISFYTFQTMSYSIDIYHNKLKPETHLGKFALFVTFFPQLVAGPIERANKLIPQLKNLTYKFNHVEFIAGLHLIAWGFFKKIVIADRLALYVDLVYDSPAYNSGLNLLIGTYFFTFQIYCDFSGYSDIAIGLALTMGVRLMTNFNSPYSAVNIQDFWNRWHISLSTWFRDYVYIPLGGSRVSQLRFYFNISAVFIISGFWHGANWTFLVWGALHALYYFIQSFGSSLTNNWSKNFPKATKILAVFITFHAVVLAWIFFRANSISDAILILSKIFNLGITKNFVLTLPGFGIFSLFLSFISIIILSFYDSYLSKCNRLHSDEKWQILFIATCIALILIIGVLGSKSFIYFQF